VRSALSRVEANAGAIAYSAHLLDLQSAATTFWRSAGFRETKPFLEMKGRLGAGGSRWRDELISKLRNR
jgi:hypothetical protein